MVIFKSNIKNSFVKSIALVLITDSIIQCARISDFILKHLHSTYFSIQGVAFFLNPIKINK